jgi:lysophospholipase L1-like esterase
MKELKTIVVFGDSASVGFSTKGRSYGVVLAELLGATRVEVSAGFGRTTRDVLDQHASVLDGLHPDLIVLQTGMADSLMHPGRRVQLLMEHFAPKAWHGVDGLERRAVYSTSWSVRVSQRVAASAKTGIKRMTVALTGGFTRMQPAEYGECLDQLLTSLQASCPLVMTITPYEIDERVFPRQRRSARRFIDVGATVLARHPSVIPVEVDPVLDRWDDYLGDNGHWNASGHATVAAEIARSLRAAHPEVFASTAAPSSV